MYGAMIFVFIATMFALVKERSRVRDAYHFDGLLSSRPSFYFALIVAKRDAQPYKSHDRASSQNTHKSVNLFPLAHKFHRVVFPGV